MQIRQRADAIDTRMVYRIYAAVAGLAGLVLSGWGPLWLGAHLPGQPWGKAALIRLLGSILMAAACFALALAGVDDPLSRRRGLLWFGAGHTVVYLAASIQQRAIWGPGLADWAVWLPFAAGLTFFYLWLTAEGDPPPPRRLFISLFGGDPQSSTERLRSTYEHQIRLAASQEERNRLARDLHDSIKQQIFVIQTAAATVQARFDHDAAGARQAVQQVRDSAREAMTEMEAMLDQLRAAPLENVGLVEALKKQCEALGFRTGGRVEFEAGKLPPNETLAPGAQQAVFRAAQEALANIGRHARASNVLVALGSAGARLELRIQDDGIGFDPNETFRGTGIANMRERAKEFGGIFELASRPGGGTSVSFSVPYAVGTPRAEYRRQACQWGATLIVGILVAIWIKSIFIACTAVISAIGLAREASAWYHTRRQSEAAP